MRHFDELTLQQRPAISLLPAMPYEDYNQFTSRKRPDDDASSLRVENTPALFTCDLGTW